MPGGLSARGEPGTLAGVKSSLARFLPLRCGLGFLAIALCLYPVAVRADEAAKLTIINEIFEVTHADTLIQQVYQQMETSQKAQLAGMEPFKDNPQLADKVWTRMYAFIGEHLSWNQLKPEMVKLYADNFTEEELAATLNFYKSPAGQAVMQKMPTIMNGAMTMTQQKMTALMPELQKIIIDTIESDTRTPAAPKTPES